MIAAWMLYSLGVSALLYAAARAAEVVSSAFRVPTRWTWIGAMLASVAVSGAALVRGRTAPTAPTAPHIALETARLASVVVTIPAAMAPSRAPRPSLKLTIQNTLIDGRAALGRMAEWPRSIEVAALDRWNIALIVLWVALSGTVLAALVAADVRLRRLERSFTRRIIAGEPLFVSTDVGPAAFGVLRPRIVLPAWTFELPHAARATIYEHEREHVAANDPALLCLAFFIVTLQPWNVVFWLGRARLRRAIEADCDRRVIGANRRSVEEYARLILSVYERCAVRRVPYMAFASHPSNLEQRLRQMTHRRRRSSIIVAACAGSAIALTVCAWAISTPDLHAASVERANTPRLLQASAVQTQSATAPLLAPTAQSHSPANVSTVVPAPAPQRIRAYGLQIVDSTTRLGMSRQALAAASTLAPCRSQGDQANRSPANCEIVGRIVVFAIDSSHILVAYRDPDDTTSDGNAAYWIFSGTPGSIPQIRWRSVGNAAFRDNVLDIESASTGRPAIVIGSHEAEMRAKYPNARAIVVASASVLLRDPGVDWDTLWELPMSWNCLSTYPLASSSEALAHDSAHTSTTPSRGCVVRQGQSLRVVRY